MNRFPLVSIIIPTYNRAHLLQETLDSILGQNYNDWECLVIDDRSTDDTENVLRSYINNDERFRYYKRPNSKPKGANACRNIGLDECKGEYIIFFDSDDLMTSNHVEIKIKALVNNQCDYVITKTNFFNNPSQNIILENQYLYETNDITPYNYVSHKINWLTCDLCVSAKLAKTISFNESLQSGQEYNYYCKLVLISTHAVFVSKIVSLIRHHDNSIRGDLRSSKIDTVRSYLITYLETYVDTKKNASKLIKQFLVYRCYRLISKLPIKDRLFENNIRKAIVKEFGLKGFYYVFRLYLNRVL